MKRLKLAMLLLSAFPLVLSDSTGPAMARPPEDRRADRNDSSQPADPAPEGSNVANVSVNPGKTPGAADPELVEETWNFIKENSPNRFQHMKKRKLRLGPAMVSRFLELRALKTEDQDLYNIRVDEMKQEDVIFPLIVRHRENPNDPANDKLLHSEVAKLVDLRIKEHRQRIAKLKELLTAETEKLDHLTSNREDAIQKRLSQEKNGALFAPGASNLRREQSEIPAPDPAP